MQIRKFTADADFIYRASQMFFLMDDELEAKHNLLRANPPMHACHFVIRSHRWLVKLYLAGKQRTLGWFEDSRNASRFADMAISHFWKYRKTLRDITDADLNYSIANVKYDIDTHPKVSALLCELEGHWLKTGELPDLSQKPVDPAGSPISKPRAISILRNAHAKNLRAVKEASGAFSESPAATTIIKILEDKLAEMLAAIHSLNNADKTIQ